MVFDEEQRLMVENMLVTLAAMQANLVEMRAGCARISAIYTTDKEEEDLLVELENSNDATAVVDADEGVMDEDFSSAHSHMQSVVAEEDAPDSAASLESQGKEELPSDLEEADSDHVVSANNNHGSSSLNSLLINNNLVDEGTSLCSYMFPYGVSFSILLLQFGKMVFVPQLFDELPDGDLVSSAGLYSLKPCLVFWNFKLGTVVHSWFFDPGIHNTQGLNPHITNPCSAFIRATKGLYLGQSLYNGDFCGVSNIAKWYQVTMGEEHQCETVGVTEIGVDVYKGKEVLVSNINEYQSISYFCWEPGPNFISSKRWAWVLVNNENQVGVNSGLQYERRPILFLLQVMFRLLLSSRNTDAILPCIIIQGIELFDPGINGTVYDRGKAYYPPMCGVFIKADSDICQVGDVRHSEGFFTHSDPETHIVFASGHCPVGVYCNTWGQRLTLNDRIATVFLNMVPEKEGSGETYDHILLTSRPKRLHPSFQQDLGQVFSSVQQVKALGFKYCVELVDICVNVVEGLPSSKNIARMSLMWYVMNWEQLTTRVLDKLIPRSYRRGIVPSVVVRDGNLEVKADDKDSSFRFLVISSLASDTLKQRAHDQEQGLGCMVGYETLYSTDGLTEEKHSLTISDLSNTDLQTNSDFLFGPHVVFLARQGNVSLDILFGPNKYHIYVVTGCLISKHRESLNFKFKGSHDIIVYDEATLANVTVLGVGYSQYKDSRYATYAIEPADSCSCTYSISDVNIQGGLNAWSFGVKLTDLQEVMVATHPRFTAMQQGVTSNAQYAKCVTPIQYFIPSSACPNAALPWLIAWTAQCFHWSYHSGHESHKRYAPSGSVLITFCNSVEEVVAKNSHEWIFKENFTLQDARLFYPCNGSSVLELTAWDVPSSSGLHSIAITSFREDLMRRGLLKRVVPDCFQLPKGSDFSIHVGLIPWHAHEDEQSVFYICNTLVQVSLRLSPRYAEHLVLSSLSIHIFDPGVFGWLISILAFLQECDWGQSSLQTQISFAVLSNVLMSKPINCSKNWVMLVQYYFDPGIVCSIVSGKAPAESIVWTGYFGSHVWLVLLVLLQIGSVCLLLRGGNRVYKYGEQYVSDSFFSVVLVLNSESEASYFFGSISDDNSSADSHTAEIAHKEPGMKLCNYNSTLSTIFSLLTCLSILEALGRKSRSEGYSYIGSEIHIFSQRVVLASFCSTTSPVIPMKISEGVSYVGGQGITTITILFVAPILWRIAWYCLGKVITQIDYTGLEYLGTSLHCSGFFCDTISAAGCPTCIKSGWLHPAGPRWC